MFDKTRCSYCNKKLKPGEHQTAFIGQCNKCWKKLYNKEKKYWGY